MFGNSLYVVQQFPLKHEVVIICIFADVKFKYTIYRVTQYIIKKPLAKQIVICYFKTFFVNVKNLLEESILPNC